MASFFLDTYASGQIVESSAICLNKIDQSRIDALVEDILSRSHTPGVSIAFINGDQTMFMSYGYANMEENILVTSDTLFEIGSMSKAFTGMAILLLEDEGLLSLSDPITMYIPWLRLQFNGIHGGRRFEGDADLTVANFLFHTSGIPFRSIGYITQSVADYALEETVRTLVGMELDFFPGTRHRYATINYNVLGYVIQRISGQSYEDFMRERILEPLGLNNTHLFHAEAREAGCLAQGYKMAFFRARSYDAPIYRGSTPTGYIISNSVDMERWMRIQMGQIEISEQFNRIIERSHWGDTTVPAQGFYHYGAGWNVHIRGENIFHGGSNPTFSSMLIIQPQEGMAISILANMNSNAAGYLAWSILNIAQNREIIRYVSHPYTGLDFTFSIITVLAIIIGVLYLFLLIKSVIELFMKKKTILKMNLYKLLGFLLFVILMSFLGFSIYFLPNILFQRMPWDMVNVWASPMIMMGSILGFIAFSIFMVYVLFTFNFPKKNEKGYFSLVPLALINGAMSALIIFTINESFNRNLEYSNELLVYFIFSVLFYMYTIKLLQGRLIEISNELVYEKRIAMIDKIMCSSYQAIESVGRDRIFSGLNLDIAALSRMPGIIIGFITSLLTVIFCLALLFTRSVWAFSASLAVILLNGVVSLITSLVTSKYWEKNRDITDTYYGQMQDLVNGFKELVLNRLRRFVFWLEMKRFSRMSADLNKEASLKLLNFDLYNSIMYNLIFGVVIFAFPILILDLDANQLRENLFIVFYMIGPFGIIAGIIPQIAQVNIHWKRIKKLMFDLDKVSTGDVTIDIKTEILHPKSISIQLKEVIYSYKSENKDGQKEDSDFTLGPITVDFNSSELVFITGGNGSGKSTLGKLITGLYIPQQGEILVNGKEVELKELNELFSSVYGDFNLFKKLYGIDYLQKKDIMHSHLDMMKITDKVELSDDGEFKTLNLSTGQRKRLAFAVSYLEDKPMMILDEWAAEQDPEFRAYFYDVLLPMLKRQEKGVIVITHDDRYFNRADRVIKLEHGLLV